MNNWVFAKLSDRSHGFLGRAAIPIPLRARRRLPPEVCTRRNIIHQDRQMIADLVPTPSTRFHSGRRAFDLRQNLCNTLRTTDCGHVFDLIRLE
jgi:hypothetical protein